MNVINIKSIDDSLIPVSIEGTEKILNQMRKSVCKIYKEDGTKGTGFFCRLKYEQENIYFYLLISNNHILEENDLKIDKKIVISINNEDEFKVIKIDKSRKVYTSTILDVSFVEIKPDIDKINDFIDIDEKIYKSINFINDLYSKKSIYTLHYPKGKNISVSYGLILGIKDNSIHHLCYTEDGSSGSPILSLDNFKLIGIHYGKSNLNYNIGTFIKNPILDFLNQIKNEQNINTINKSLKNKFAEIDKFKNKMTVKYRINNGKNIKIFGDDFVKNNKDNCFIILDENQFEISSEFEIQEDYIKEFLEIKLIETNNIDNMSHMFDECSTLLDLPDICKWDTSFVIDMSYMFFGCTSLNNISDISVWNMSKVENLNCLFCNCSSLKKIPDISKWDTSNVKNMNGMFYGCKLLYSLPDISIWNISHVKDMNYMFSNCLSLISIPDISRWDIKNSSIYGMFNGCNKSLQIPSKFK